MSNNITELEKQLKAAKALKAIEEKQAEINKFSAFVGKCYKKIVTLYKRESVVFTKIVAIDEKKQVFIVMDVHSHVVPTNFRGTKDNGWGTYSSLGIDRREKKFQGFIPQDLGIEITDKEFVAARNGVYGLSKINFESHMPNYEYQLVAEDEPFDIPHIMLTTDEEMVMGKTNFLIDHTYLLSPNSIKFGFKKIEEAKEQLDQISVYAQSCDMAYINRKETAIVTLRNKLMAAKTP